MAMTARIEELLLSKEEFFNYPRIFLKIKIYLIFDTVLTNLTSLLILWLEFYHFIQVLPEKERKV